MPDCSVPVPAPAAVLDTNAALDWLVFDDARIRPLAFAISAGSVRWLTSPALRGELVCVLAQPTFAERLAARTGNNAPLDGPALTAYDRLSHQCPDPPAAAAPHDALHCRDPDDQIFLDLAVAVSARWLITRDKALLALGARASKRGLTIVVSEAWSAG